MSIERGYNELIQEQIVYKNGIPYVFSIKCITTEEGYSIYESLRITKKYVIKYGLFQGKEEVLRISYSEVAAVALFEVYIELFCKNKEIIF